MPNHYTHMKDIYQKMYDELKNKKSPIGIFLSRVDELKDVKGAEGLKKAAKEYMKLFEAESKNFVEPKAGDGPISYRDEAKRLNTNLEVEKKLKDAVQNMEKAMDVIAVSILPMKKKEYTPEQIAEMTDYGDKLRAQRDRVLNASYGLEVEMEEEMVKKLKEEYQLFDHRPYESQVKPSPHILESPQYRFRHMELKGDAEVPTSLYGLMRFRDMLNDHQSVLTEAERSRQYTKFVNDRLAGYQAWKNTFEKENKVYEEISSAVDPDYFREYNKFMDDYPATSSQEGYRMWFKETYKSIEEMRKDINDLEREQESFEEAINNLELEMKELVEGQEIEKITYDNAIKEAQNDEKLTPQFSESNAKTRENSQILLSELKEQLKKVDGEMSLLDQEQNAAQKTMLENVQQIQFLNNELSQLQKDLENDGQDALKKFLKNHATSVKHLDKALQDNLDAIGRMAQELDAHNENIKKAEDDIKTYSDQVKTRRDELDDITKVYEEAQKKANKDLKEQTSFGKKFARAFKWGDSKLKSLAELEAAESQKLMTEAYQENVASIKKNVETNEKYLADTQDQLKSYKDGWNATKKTLSEKIKESVEYTQELQVKFNALEKEKETQMANLDYEQKVKEIQADAGEKQKTYQNILDKTSDEFDRLKIQKLQKIEEKKKIMEQIQKVQDVLTSCDKAEEDIRIAKEKVEEARKAKEHFEKTKGDKISSLQAELDDALERAANGKTRIGEKKLQCETRIKSHDKMAAFFKEGKVTSDRILKDLNGALKESFRIAARESKRQLRYIKRKENELMKEYLFKLKDDKEFYADRVKKVQEADEKKQKAEKNNAENNVEKKSQPLDSSIRGYMRQLSARKKSNSVEFQRFEKAVLRNFDEFNNFLLDDEVSDAVRIDYKREETIKEIKSHLKEIAEASKAYMKAKGSASRFTNEGKDRYRFADEMRTFAEDILDKMEILEKEKVMADKLMNMDDKNLVVSKNTSFYKTDSYKMTRHAFVGVGELDQMDGLNAGKRELPGDKKPEAVNKEAENSKEEKVLENKEEPVLNDGEESIL